MFGSSASAGPTVAKLLQYGDTYQPRSVSCLCEVCGLSSSANEENVLVTCRSCALRVHPSCYGIKAAESFECSECRIQRKYDEIWGRPDEDPSFRDCFLCPVPKTFLRDARTSGDVIDISEIKDSWKGWRSTCVICKLKGLGACVGCGSANCTAWVHPSCASSPFGEKVGFEVNFGARSILCPGHSRYAATHPELAREFLRMVGPPKPQRVDPNSIKKKKAALPSTSSANVEAPDKSNMSRRLETTPTSIIIKIQKPAKFIQNKLDPEYVGRRVSVFSEGLIGTVTKIKRNKYVIALDDDKIQLERLPEEVRLIPVRQPGCVVCGSRDNTEEILLCDGCDVEMHMKCHSPPIPKIPAGSWFCDDCTVPERTRLSATTTGTRQSIAVDSGKKKPISNGKLPNAKRKRVAGEEHGGSEAEEVEEEEEEDIPEEEGDDIKKRRQSSSTGGSKHIGGNGNSSSSKTAIGKKANPSAISSTNGADISVEVKEESINFEALFPDLTVVDWTRLFQEIDRVYRADLVVVLARFGPRSVAERLLSSSNFAKRIVSLVLDAFIMQELPAACLEGFLRYRISQGDSLNDAEMKTLKQIYTTTSDLHLDIRSIPVSETHEAIKVFQLSSDPFLVPEQQFSESPLDSLVSSGEGARDGLDDALQTCTLKARSLAKTLIPIDVESLVSECEKALESSKQLKFYAEMSRAFDRLKQDYERTLSRSRLPALKARDLFRRLETRLRHVRTTEPSAKGEWRKTPFPRRPYEVIGDYEPVTIPEEKGEEERTRIMHKLETTKTPNCDESERCSDLAPYSLKLNAFVTDRPCLSRRVGCRASTIGKDAPLILKRDVVEYDAWGIDTATRKFIDSMLEYVAEISSSHIQTAVVEGMLLKCIHAQPQDLAHDINHAVSFGLTCLRKCMSLTAVHGESATEGLERLLMADALSFTRKPIGSSEWTGMPLVLDLYRGLQAVELAAKMFEIQIRPKGVGIRCEMKSGFKAGTFVSRYLGELYAPWRWFERQDAVKAAQSKLSFKPPLPDFYNIMLERHEDDPDGYDVLFVDPIVRGNFASRLCHSCDPNCATVVMAVNGQFVIAVYALRDVEYGEELTFDYSSVTEDEAEFRAAICLCGSSNCRGSFLFFAGTGAFASVLGTHHTFLDRVAIVLLSSTEYEMLDSDDEARLVRYGIGQSMMQGLPQWLRKWVALTLRFVDFEKTQLAKDLLAKGTFTEDSARLEAYGVAENRRQNVAITLDKLGYFFRSCESTDHPLRRLSDQEVVEFLWNGSDSVAKRAIQAASGSKQISVQFEVQLVDFVNANAVAVDLADAKRLLMELMTIFWNCPLNASLSFCESCGDVLLMHALTDTWFTSNSFKGFKSPSVTIRNVDIGRDATVMASASAAAAPVNSSAALGLNFTCTRDDLLGIFAGEGVHGDFHLEKEDDVATQVPGTSKLYAFRNAKVDGLVPAYIYRTVDALMEDVISLEPLASSQSHVLKFTMFVYTTPVREGLEHFRLKAVDGQLQSIFVLTDKSLRKAIFLPPTVSLANVDKLSASALKVVFNEPKKYQSGFAWGQLIGWFKQTVSDPSASLSAERRGSLSLPDIETCFSKEPDVNKFNKSRKDMLKKIKEKPDGMWPVSWPYSFKNKEKIYGSPWFDDFLDSARAGDFIRRNERCNKFMQMMSDHMAATGQL